MGFPAGLSGNDLALRGVIQMLKFGAHLYAPVNITRLEPATKPGERHKLHLGCGATVEASTVLIASGMHWRKLDAQGADRFERAGIYYICTTIEAVLHDHTDVGVVGAGNSAGQAATFLAECCPTRTVHIFARRQLGLTMSRYLVDRITSMPNIQVHENTTVTSVYGDKAIEAVDVERLGQTTRLPIAALFVFIGADPCVDWLPEDLGRDEKGFILTGSDVLKSGKWPESRTPCPLETTIPGILAAGDVRSGSTKRVGFAVGDGAQSVACVHELLAAGTVAFRK
jgi:thioredoxin reductase (NADPH)